MDKIRKLGFALYTILIPIMFISMGNMSRHLGISINFSQLVAQISVLLLMVPYFSVRKDYFKIPPNIIKLFAVIFLIEISISATLAILGGGIMIFGISSISILRVLSIVIFAPIIEEMYFRGMLQDCLNTLSPTTTKLTPFLSAGLFGLGHVRYSGTIVIFLIAGIGYISSMLLEKYKNLYPSIFFHSIYNFIQVFIRIAKVG